MLYTNEYMIDARKSAALFLTLAIALGSFGCTLLVANAMAPMVGSSSNCVSMGGNPVVCQGTANHITWQQLISIAIPQKPLALGLLLLSLLVFIFAFRRFKLFDPEQERARIPISFFNALLLPRTPLQEAFSNGIIHSKAY